jgi:hypothetical protein
MSLDIVYREDKGSKLTSLEVDENFRQLADALSGGTLSDDLAQNKVYIGNNLNKAEQQTLNTALVPETTNKNYQTDNQKLYNDATSSIQTQLNAKANDTDVLHKTGNETATGIKTFSDQIKTPLLSANTSGGLVLESNSGTDVVLLGAGGGSGATFYGGVIILNSLYLGTGTKNNSAISQADSTTQGFLGVPRMTTSQRDLISPVNGLLIYNLTTLTYNYYNGTTWVTIGRQFQTFNTTFYNPLFLQDVGFTDAGTINKITNNNGVFATVEYSTNAGTSYTTLTFTGNVWIGSISVAANSSLRFRITFSGVNVQGTLTINESLT